MLFTSDLSLELAENSTVKWHLQNTPVNHYFYNLANYFELRTPFYSSSQNRLFSSYKLAFENNAYINISITPIQKINENFSLIDSASLKATNLYFTGSNQGGVRQPIVSKLDKAELKPVCTMQEFYDWAGSSEKAADWICPVLTEKSFQINGNLMAPQIRIYMINLSQNHELSSFEKTLLRNYAMNAMDSLAAPIKI